MTQQVERSTTQVRERGLDGILRQATVGFAQVEPSGRFVAVNQRYCDLVGRTRDDLLTLYIQDITHPDDLAAALVLFKGAAESGQDFVIEKRYVRPDGSTVWVNNSVYALMDAAGRPEYVVAICQDITAQKQAQEALRRSEQRYRSIFDTVAVSLWEEDLTDVKGVLERVRATGVTDFRRYFAEHPEFVGYCLSLVKVVDVNAASLRMFAASDKDQLLRSFTDIFEARALDLLGSALVSLVEGRTKFEGETFLRTLGGQRLSVLVSITFPPADDTEGSTLVSLTDITARKRAEDVLRESEAHFRTMADTAPAMLWITDCFASCAFLSQGWYEFTGQLAGAGLGRGWTEAVHPDDRPAVVAAVTAGHDERQPFRVEYRLRRADGQYRWTIDAGRPRFQTTGAFLGHIGAVIDIHERRGAEQALQEAYRSLEHTSHVKDEFLATLSHELRTPLNAVLGWSRMLRVGAMRPDVQTRALESIERNAMAQSQLVDDLLDVSRIISGKLQLKSEAVDLAQVIAGAVDATRPGALAKGLTMEVEVDPRTQILVTGDAGRLQQVVWNLLSNATKFTPSGGRVHVALSVVDSHARIVVADTGQGISPAFLPHIFERFRQEDGTLARKHTGLGLGLSIVRHLTEAHGGTITAESAGESRGATFITQLPVREIRQAPPSSPRPDATRARCALPGLRVLVVDDDIDARDLVRTVLETIGAVVTPAGSAEEALQCLDRGWFDVMIADIGMPSQDGYSLIGAVRRRPKELGGGIPTIAVTAYASVRDRERALEAGFDRHLTKPVDSDLLTAEVAALCSVT